MAIVQQCDGCTAILNDVFGGKVVREGTLTVSAKDSMPRNYTIAVNVAGNNPMNEVMGSGNGDFRPDLCLNCLITMLRQVPTKLVKR